ncbi:hypothetical protein BDV11DRAFT_196457 [Aspergillus similis]
MKVSVLSVTKQRHQGVDLIYFNPPATSRRAAHQSAENPAIKVSFISFLTGCTGYIVSGIAVAAFPLCSLIRAFRSPLPYCAHSLVGDLPKVARILSVLIVNLQ